MKVTENYLYWACQCAGWGGYSAAMFAIISHYNGWHLNIAAGFGLFFLYSMTLTHLLRRQILRRGWLMLPAAPGLVRILAAATGVAAVQTVLIVSITWLLGGENRFDAAAIAFTAPSLVFVTCSWAALYLGISWYRRYRQAQLREVQLQLALRHTELRALQAQVNPHFLFNCLNTIRGMVREDPQRAQDMITTLAKLFRRSLNCPGEQMIALAEEMEGVSEYLELESTRFEERLQVCVDVREDAGKCAVPAMLVQTLVENAVKHGISHLPRGGTVSVRGTVGQASLVLTVENTGTLREPDPRITHTGLANARERLRLLYGEQASLALSDENGTVTATLVIPLSQ
jgi:LytS/YehU family sensor histidine kinase